MPRGLDHIVHAVRDLDAAAALYRGLGFTVGARNRHPWGTHNHIVQVPGFFLELLSVVEPDKLGSDGFSEHFGGYHQRFLARQEGLSFLMLESADVAADAAEISAAGFPVSEVLTFERDAAGPDGVATRVGFSLAFTRDPLAADIGFALSHSRNPDRFWNPALQQHPNGANDIGGAVLVAENPSDHHIFLSALTGERELLATSSGITLPTPRGVIRVMDPAAYKNHFGRSRPAMTAGAQVAALQFKVRDLDALQKTLAGNGVPFTSRIAATVVGPETAMGATLVFEAA